MNPDYKTRVQLRKFISWNPSEDNSDLLEQIKTELESTGWEVLDYGLRGEEYIVEACARHRPSSAMSAAKEWCAMCGKWTDHASGNCPESASELATAQCSPARTLAIELAKQIEEQDEQCEYPHVPTERLESLIEKFLQERGLAPENTQGKQTLTYA